MGGDRARRDRPGRPARHADQRVRGRFAVRLCQFRRRHLRFGGAPDHGYVDECAVRPHRVHAGSDGPGRVGGHGLFLVPGGCSPRGAVAACGGVHDGLGGRGDRAGRAGRVRGVLGAERAGAGRPLQGVRGGRRRHGHGRGGGRGRAGAAFRGPPQRPQGAGHDRGQRPQPGRRVERPVRAERSLAAPRDPRRPVQRPPDDGRCGRGGGARDRDDAG